MKYHYAYRTSDGERLEAHIDSSSRDAAFAELRRQGIRPIKVIAEDGSKENGARYGVRKRVVAAVAAFVGLAAVVATTLDLLRRDLRRNRRGDR